jgi:hydrogenase-4 component F
MLALLLIGVPLMAAGLALVVPGNRSRPVLLPVAALGHLGLALAALYFPPMGALGNWLILDPLGKVFLPFVSVLFLFCAAYSARYLTLEKSHPALGPDGGEEEGPTGEKSNRVFCACFLLSLSMITLVILSHHLGLMWVAMEATTLALAPNILFHKTPRSLEATWKYLVICSVGIALALLGCFFLAYSTLQASRDTTLLFEDLVRDAPTLSRPWLQAAFVFILVGYGTKMGLAPMHTWLPDAHGEAPAPVSALLSGALLPCALLAILRVFQVCQAAGDAESSRRMLIGIGLFSMAVAAVFMAGQRDLKRLLAYSSVEHMGILAFSFGIGGLATFGALLHVIANGLTKCALFLCAGNIQHAFGSKLSNDVRGALRRLPVTGPLFLAGFLAITGSPPFGPFVSEFTIVNGALAGSHFLLGAFFLLMLAVAFIGMGATILPTVQGEVPEQAMHTDFRDGLSLTAPILAALALVVLLGVYLPPPLESLLREAARFLEARP